ncbi:unnamed protein product [Effrenium voratum]|nr:unnamed protein product [Effrenium voratum]
MTWALQVEVLVDLLEVIRLDAHTVREPSQSSQKRHGLGLFYWLHLANHSCWPNAFFQSSRNEQEDYATMTLLALRPLDPGDEVCISYVDGRTLLSPLHVRRHVIQQQFGFLCTCPRCCQEESASQTKRERMRRADSRLRPVRCLCLSLGKRHNKLASCEHPGVQKVIFGVPGYPEEAQSWTVIGTAGCDMESQMSGISPQQVRLGFIRKVYGIVCAQVTATSIFAGACVAGPLREPMVAFAQHSGLRFSGAWPAAARVAALQAAAQRHFARGRLALVAQDGRRLEPAASLSEALETGPSKRSPNPSLRLPDVKEGLRDGDAVTAIAQPVEVAATRSAFALCIRGGKAITWGHAENGGDSSKVQEQLTQVRQIQATQSAFAAILSDGTAVTWGDPESGGDSSRVRHRLRGISQIQASSWAFAAIQEDGGVVTWGKTSSGGDSCEVADQLTRVQQIQATEGAFAAIRNDGTVVTWGDPDIGGDSCQVREQLRGVRQIQANDRAFAAISEDSVVTWGHPKRGGDSHGVQEQFRNVKQIQATWGAFAAVKGDGTVVTWGDPGIGGDSSRVKAQLTRVQQLQATWLGAFAAIRHDGSVVTWGHPRYGGDSSQVREKLTSVRSLQATHRAFAALRDDGTVVTWGEPQSGGDCVEQLSDVTHIQANDRAFAALVGDGAVVAWGDVKPVAEYLTQVQQIQATSFGGFCAIRSDGTSVAFGHCAVGGDCGKVQRELDAL